MWCVLSFNFFLFVSYLFPKILKYNFLLLYLVRTEMSRMRGSCALDRYVVLFYYSFQSVGRVCRYARSIGKVHSRLRQRPPDLCVAVSYNHQAAIHHRSLCWVTWSRVCLPPRVSFLLRLVFFVPCRHLFQRVKFDISVTMAFSLVPDVRFGEFYFFHESSRGSRRSCF